MTVKWYDAKKNTPHLGGYVYDKSRASEPCLVYGRDCAGIDYEYSVATYIYDEEDGTGEWNAYDYAGFDMSEVIAWTPLPEPPKTAKEIT